MRFAINKAMNKAIANKAWVTPLLALSSGITMGLTSAPTNGWMLAWGAQAPLWVLVYGDGLWNKIQPIVVAVLWSIGYYGTTLSWITGLHPLTWMGIPWLASVAIAFTCWGLVVLWGCVWSGLWAMGLAMVVRQWLPISQSTGWPRVLVGTALWCGLDTLWSHSLLYWPTMAFTQSPHNLWLLQLNQLSGPTMTTAVIVAVNGLLAEGWIAYRRALQKTGDQKSGNPSLRLFRAPLGQYLAGVIGLVAIAHLVGGWLYNTHSPAIDSWAMDPLGINSRATSTQKSVNVGLIQANIPTFIKLTGQGMRQAFDRYTEGYQSLADQGADVVLMPEGALPIVWDINGDPRNPVADAIGDRHVPAILGTFVPSHSFPNDNGNPFTVHQSLLLVMPTQHDDAPSTQHRPQTNVITRSQYNKVKLVPLGEYIPAEGILGGIINRLSPLQSTMIPGQPHQIFKTPWGIITSGICYESAFPDLFRRQTRAGGEWMITASNNDPYNGAMMAQHHAQDVMRAIENDRWTVRVTNTGYSGLVSPRGDTRWRSQRNQRETYLATIQRRQSRTLYVRWGNWITPLLLGATLVTILWSLWSRHRL